MQAANSIRQLWLRAGAVQLTAVVLATLASYWMNLSLGNWMLITAILAGVLAYQSDLPRWFMPVQILFLPALFYVYQLALPAWLYLFAFVILFAVYGRVFTTRVPLYLSGKLTCDALAELLPQEHMFHFLDLGAGTGTVLRNLDRRFPFGMFHGVETAPVPFVMAWLRSKIGKAQFRIFYQDLWQTHLDKYDVVYAFLSPHPMPELWQKVKREMKPGSLFISNSFAVPGVQPDQIIELEDGRSTALYVWRL